VPTRPPRCLLLLVLLGCLLGLSVTATAAGLKPPTAQATEVSPSGEEYDPDGLATTCVQNVWDEHTGNVLFLWNTQRLTGVQEVSLPVAVMPMQSGAPGVNCPAPAWEHERLRLLIRTNRLRDEPVTDWQAAPDAQLTNYNPDGPEVPPQETTLVFTLWPGKTYQPCYPLRVEEIVRRRLRRRGVLNPTVDRAAFVQIQVRAHSGDHETFFSRKHSLANFNRANRCRRAPHGR
jgi:hypothetical protein